MKKTIIALAVVLIAGTVSSFAQGGGGFQMPTPEERVKRVHGKADSAFKLELIPIEFVLLIPGC